MDELVCHVHSGYDLESQPQSIKRDVYDPSLTDGISTEQAIKLYRSWVKSARQFFGLDYVNLPGLSLHDSPDESDKVRVKEDSDTQKAYEKAKMATAWIGPADGSGSGFFVSDGGRIVTASHVVPWGAKELDIKTSDGAAYKARFISRDSFNDLAVLEVVNDKNRKFSFLPVNETAVANGEAVASIGHPLGWSNVYISPGKRVGSIPLSDRIQRWTKSDELLAINSHVEGGNSGGALVDGCGSVRGVTVGTNLNSTIAAVIPAKAVKDLLAWTESNRKNGNQRYPSVGDAGTVGDPGSVGDAALFQKQASALGKKQFRWAQEEQGLPEPPPDYKSYPPSQLQFDLREYFDLRWMEPPAYRSRDPYDSLPPRDSSPAQPQDRLPAPSPYGTPGKPDGRPGAPDALGTRQDYYRSPYSDRTPQDYYRSPYNDRGRVPDYYQQPRSQYEPGHEPQLEQRSESDSRYSGYDRFKYPRNGRLLDQWNDPPANSQR